MVSATHTGRVRAHNEDHLGVDPQIGLAVVADGMGGHNAGEVASGMAVTLMFTELRTVFSTRSADTLSGEEARQHLSEQMAKTNTAIYYAARSQPQYAGMGTTLVAALWHGREMTVGHLGDSRLYRLRGTQFEQITRDHSWAQERIDSGLMTQAQAATAPNKNLITRACGVEPHVEAEVHTYAVEADDIYLLCSDGLSNMVADGQLCLTLTSLKENLPLAAEQLVQQANDNGGKDNISLALVRVLHLKPAHAGFASRLKGWFD